MEAAVAVSSERSSDLDLAFYSERAVAFAIDLALAVGGYFLSLKAAFPEHGSFINPYAYAWTWLWAGLFVAYQAFANADGRSSWGKALVGIRVCGLDGRPLPLGRSALRAGGYLLSSLFYLGFLWPLFDARVQTWHDLLAGSVVVQNEPRAARPALVAGAWAVAGALAAHWVWVFVLSGPFYRVRTISHARVGLQDLASLEQEYKETYGRYTDNLFTLAEMTGAPDAFLKAQTALFDTSRGVDLTPTPRGIRISAYARDERRTPVHLDVE